MVMVATKTVAILIEWYAYGAPFTKGFSTSRYERCNVRSRVGSEADMMVKDGIGNKEQCLS